MRPHDLTLNAGTQNIIFGDAVGKNTALNSVTITKAANIDVKSNITTINDLNLNNPVTLNDSTAQIFTSNTGNITLGKVDGAADLTLNATTAGKEVTLNDAVGGTKKLNSLTSNSTKTTIANNITTKNDITLNSPVTLKDSTAPTLTSDEGNISLSNTVDGASDLTLTASKGNVTLNGAVGETTNLNSLSSNTTKTNIGSNITTKGTQQFNSPVNLNANSTLTFKSTNSDINFQKTLDGTGKLTLTNGSGKVTFGDNVGDTTALNGLSISNTGGTIAPAKITTKNADISISSPITLTSSTNINAGTGTIAIGDSLTASANDLTLTADEINLIKANSISGTGKLILQPSTSTQNIALGGTSDTGTSTLDLTTTDLAAFQSGFSSITIGNSNASGTISVNNTANTTTFNNPLILANQTSLGANLSNTNQSITFQKPVSLGADATVTTGNGDINFQSTVDGANNLTLNAGSNQITFGDAVGKKTASTALSSISITNASKINVNSDITTKNDLSLSKPVTLTGTSQTLTSNTGNITLGSIDGAGDLTLNASKVVTLSDAVGGTTNLNSLTSTATQTNIAKNITTVKDINVNNPVNLTGNGTQTFKSNTGNISLGAVDGTSDLTLNASKAVTLSGAVGGTANLNSLTSTATQTNIASNITTNTGTLQFNSPVNLTGSGTQTFNSTNSDINFQSTLDGTGNLTLTNGSGKVTFGGNIGDTTALNGLSISNTGGTIAPAKITTKNADISISSPITLNSSTNINAGTGTIAISDSLTAGANDLTLTADEINLIKANSISGSGKLILQPSTNNQNIALGGTSDTGTSTLDLTTTDLAAFQSGFSSITIGNSNDSGTISVNNTANTTTFNNPLILANNTALGANLSNTNQPITFQKPVSLTKDVTVTTGNGDLNFQNTVDGTGKLTMTNGTGKVTFGGNVGDTTALNGLSISNTGGTIAPAKITTKNADITISSPITLNSSTNINAGTGTIAIGDSLTASANDLTLTADEINLIKANSISGTGKLILQPSTTNQNIALGGTSDTGTSTLDLTTTDLAAFQSGFSSITIGNSNASGTISVNNTANTTTFNNPLILANQTSLGANLSNTNQSITFQKPVSLSADATVDAGNGNINFNSTIDGTNQFTLNAGTQNINLGGAVGATTPLNNLITSAANVYIFSDIKTVNDLNFTNPVILTGTTQAFTSNTGNIEFDHRLDGASNLTLNATTLTKQVTLNSAVGGTTPLKSLTINTTKTNLANSISATNNLTLVSPVNLTGTTQTINSTSGTISLGAVDGTSDLTLTAGKDVTLNGAVGATTPLNSLTTTATNQISIPNNITTTNDLSLAGAINLTGSATEFKSSQGNISLVGGVNGATNDLTLTSTKNVTLDGGVTTLNSLTFAPSVANIYLGNNITTTKDLTLNSHVIINTDNTSLVTKGTLAITNGLTANANNLTLTADQINLPKTANSVTGNSTETSNITLQQYTPSKNIVIGGTGDSDPSNNITNTLDITQSDIAALAPNFKSITIGNPQSIGKIDINNPVIFQNSLTIQSPNGSINVNSLLTGKGSVTLIANSVNTNLTTLGAGIDTSANNQDIIFKNNVALVPGSNLTLQAGGGNIWFQKTLDGAADLSLSANNITFGGAVGAGTPLSSLDINAATKIYLAVDTSPTQHSITATGNITFKSPVELINNADNNGTIATITSKSGTITNSNSLDVKGFSLNLTADTIDLKQASLISGNETSNLTLQPFSTSQNIAIGGSNSGTGILLGANTLQDGFKSITIGRPDSNATVDIDAINFTDPVTIQSPGGSINVNGAITGTGNASVTLNSNLNTLNANITTINQPISITKNIALGTGANIDLNTVNADISLGSTGSTINRAWEFNSDGGDG